MKRLAVALLVALWITTTGCMIVTGDTIKETRSVSPPRGDRYKEASFTSFPDLICTIDDKFSDPYFAHAHWGVVIQSLDTGRIWYQRNPNRMFMPASNQKILTGTAALRRLGPDFTFTTHVCYDGALEPPVLEGDLVVFGNGDPTLYSKFYDDPREVFYSWVQELEEKGISRITGNIIGDDDAFDDQRLGYGWSYHYLDTWYAAEVGALQINENYVDLKIIPPDNVEGEIVIQPNLPSSYFEIVNNVSVKPQGRNSISIERPQGSNVITVSGSVVAGSRSFERSPTITNPTKFYVTVLKETLEEKGIAVEGKPVDCDELDSWEHEPSDFPSLIVHNSPPLAKILKGFLKRSQNLYGETLVRVLGWDAEGIGSFSTGRDIVESELSSMGVAEDTYQYMDGSGLTRYNYISPRQVTNILRDMYRHSYADVWLDALPVAGVDGTLRRRMKGTPAEGNVRAKTGTISNVRALSGYVTTGEGENLVFSFLVNGHLRSTRATEHITDDVLAMLESFRMQGKEKEKAKEEIKEK